jgi:hypothetical protein
MVKYSALVDQPPPSSRQFLFDTNSDELRRILRYFRFYRQKEFEHIRQQQNAVSERLKPLFDYDWWSRDHRLPYFFANGSFRPDLHDDPRFDQLAIWPDQTDHDRIVNQLMYMPSDYADRLARKQFKKIYINNPNHSFDVRDVPSGQGRFLTDRCPVAACQIIRNRYEAHLADAILFKVIP